MTEDQLWNEFTKGDNNKYRSLFDLFYPALCAFARQYVTSKAIGEDLVQNVFASMWENRNRIIVGKSVRNYLMVSVRNQCFDYLRREESMRQYTDYKNFQEMSEIENNAELYLLSELQNLLDQTLSKLPESYRTVFEMHRLEGKDYAEIAETLNISTRTAKRYNSITTDFLKKELKDYLPLVIPLCQLLATLELKS